MNETMRREIRSQPQILGRILSPLRQRAAALGLAHDRLFAGGCGDSYFAAVASKPLFESTANRFGNSYRACTAMELAFEPMIGSGDLCLLISISGGTARTVQAARRLSQRSAHTIAVTCNGESALAKECEQVLVLPYEPITRRIPHSTDYTATLLALAAVAEVIAGESFDSLSALPSEISACLATNWRNCAALAQRASPSTKVFYLGAAAHLGTASYAAAKLHEAGGLTAFAAETENFAHGLNFAIEPNDLVCLIAGSEPASFRAFELVPGLAKLCRSVAIMAPQSTITQCEGTVLSLADGPLTPFTAAVVGQMLCLELADRFDLDVEAPRGGRPAGDLHLKTQREWMRDTQIE